MCDEVPGTPPHRQKRQCVGRDWMLTHTTQLLLDARNRSYQHIWHRVDYTHERTCSLHMYMGASEQDHVLVRHRLHFAIAKPPFLKLVKYLVYRFRVWRGGEIMVRCVGPCIGTWPHQFPLQPAIDSPLLDHECTDDDGFTEAAPAAGKDTETAEDQVVQHVPMCYKQIMSKKEILALQIIVK